MEYLTTANIADRDESRRAWCIRAAIDKGASDVVATAKAIETYLTTAGPISGTVEERDAA